MLYVTSVFALEPVSWIAQHEWRALTQEEQEAQFALWAHYGRRMGVVGLPETRQGLVKWREGFEKEHMVYARSNALVAQRTMDLFLGILPALARHAGEKIAYCFMDKRLRVAMGYPDPNPWLVQVVNGFFWAKKVFTGYFCFPRPEWLSARRTPFTVSAGAGLCPRFNVYGDTYGRGKEYEITSLGEAPVGVVFPDGEVPIFRGPAFSGL